LKKQNSW